MFIASVERMLNCKLLGSVWFGQLRTNPVKQASEKQQVSC